MSVLVCKGVYKQFGGTQALLDFSYDFPPMGILGIVGPNGAGKTTLFNIISGFVRPDAGSCSFGSHDLTRISPHRIAQIGIARTFQNLRLIRRLSALENVMLALPRTAGSLSAITHRRAFLEEEAARRNTADSLLEQVGAASFANDLVGALSYGTQKRVTLAMALARNSKVVLLDEPTAGITEYDRELVIQVIRDIHQSGKLVIFSEHSMSTVHALAETVIVLARGQLVAEGEPASVLSDNRTLENFLG